MERGTVALIYMHVCIYMCVCIYIYIYIYICMYIYVCMYACMYIIFGFSHFIMKIFIFALLDDCLFNNESLIEFR